MKKMEFTYPRGLELIRSWALQQDLQIYVVGGWVRDSLLGLPAWDADLSGPQLPETLQACLPGDGSITLHTRDAGLGTVELHAGSQIFEYTTFRRESYRPGGAHRPSRVTLGATLAEDALRRDFSVNAMYLRLTDGAFFDPTQGEQDLALRRLRTTRSPQEVFNEDGLRLLRLIRQEAELGFTVEENTLQAASERIGYLKDIAPERLREELRRILLADTRHPQARHAQSAVITALERMHRLQAWEQLSPPTAPACARKQAILAASQAPADMVLRLACLWAGLEDETVSLCAQNLRFSREEEKQLRFLCAHGTLGLEQEAFEHLCAHAGRPQARALSLYRDVLRRQDLSPADPREPQWLRDMEERQTPFSLSELKISGRDLFSLAGGPSPRIGMLKNRLFDHCILNPHDNETERLLQLARAMMNDEMYETAGGAAGLSDAERLLDDPHR